MAAQENASRIPFTDELPPHITLAVVTRVLKVALRIAIQGIPEAPTGHEHHGFSIAVGDGDELMKMHDLGDGPEPVYFSPYDLNPFERGHLDIDENSVIRGAFNGDGLCVVDGRTAKCRAATMIVLSMRGGGSTGGGRHKSSRALSRQPGGGCWVLKCSEDDRGSKFKKFHVFFKGMEAKFLKAAAEAAVVDQVAGLSSRMRNAGMGGAAAEGAEAALLRKENEDMRRQLQANQTQTSDVADYSCNSLATARSIANDKLQGKDSDYFAAWCSQRRRIWIKKGAKTRTPHESLDVTLFTKPTKPTVNALTETEGYDMGGSDVADYSCNSLARARSIANDKLQRKDSDYFAAWCSQRQRIWIKKGAKAHTPNESLDVTLFTKPTVGALTETKGYDM